MKEKFIKWLKAAGIRALKTAAQTASPSNTDYPTTAAVIEYVNSLLRGLTNNGN